MFSHITLFNLLTKDGAVQNTSVIVSTKDNFFLEMKKGPDSVHLGGGMFGALMFATCYFLFDEVGALYYWYYFSYSRYTLYNK